MSERKVINKYYPPDFDPLKVKPKKKLNKNNNTSATTASSLQTVRLMTPFSMRCTSCGEYISKSKKFNAKKQDTNERYLQQKIFRFHIRCPRCNGEIVFRTDPKSTDFVMELGGERNYNPVKDKAQNKLESYDEILERLEREDILEREELADKEKIQKMTKIQELELKLIQQQDEEILNEELKNLIEKNAKNDGVVLKGGAGESIEDDQEFDRLAREEFEALKRELQLKEREQTKTDNGICEKVTVDKQEPVKKKLVSGSISGLVSGYDSSSDDENVNDSDEKIVKVIRIAAPKKRSFNFSSNGLSKKMKK